MSCPKLIIMYAHNKKIIKRKFMVLKKKQILKVKYVGVLLLIKYVFCF